ARMYERVEFLTDWSFGGTAPARQAQRADLHPGKVAPGGANMALVLSGLLLQAGVEDRIMELLREVHPRAERLQIHVAGGTAPLICIEEPELGLHPDLLSTLAEVLVEASRKTQLLVTTHSDLLVSQFTESPEAVVVCDHGPGGTYFRRLPPEDGPDPDLDELS